MHFTPEMPHGTELQFCGSSWLNIHSLLAAFLPNITSPQNHVPKKLLVLGVLLLRSVSGRTQTNSRIFFTWTLLTVIFTEEVAEVGARIRITDGTSKERSGSQLGKGLGEEQGENVS